jgi:3-dehydroquinate dehydratase/shikimate dehydrogenase
MLCVTGNETSLASLASRLQQVQDKRCGPDAPLQEIRIDALDEPLEPLYSLLERYRDRLLVCCRPQRQGGAYVGSDAERLAILRRAAIAGAAYVDVEADCEERELVALRHATPGKLVLSWHDFAGIPADLGRRVREIGGRGADLVKVAVTVQDAAQLGELRELQQLVSQPTIVIGMGLAGLLTRCRYPAFGSPWTYVKADAESGTAPGQLTLDEALQLGLPASADGSLYVLIGGPQVQHSKGPLVYNQLFRAWGTTWSYLPVSTADAASTFALLCQLGLQGASVTMPHKAWALALADQRASELAKQAGAANSVRLVEGDVEATNTDVAGVGDPLRLALARVGEPHPKRALVLGAGGAARAAVLACRRLGLAVTVSALEDASELCGDGVDYRPWDERNEVQAEVLVNATPVSGADKMPLSSDGPLDKRVVFDLAISGEPSLLLQRAEAEGAETIEAIEMWLAQGAEQISWLTGRRCTVAEMRALLPQ